DPCGSNDPTWTGIELPLQHRRRSADQVPLSPGLSDASVIIYLHGFASSARSTKANYFAERLRRHGITFSCPDLNEPDFSTLTITRMLNQVAGEVEAANEASVTLIGSSLGGALAVLA